MVKSLTASSSWCQIAMHQKKLIDHNIQTGIVRPKPLKQSSSDLFADTENNLPPVRNEMILKTRHQSKKKTIVERLLHYSQVIRQGFFNLKLFVHDLEEEEGGKDLRPGSLLPKHLVLLLLNIGGHFSSIEANQIVSNILQISNQDINTHIPYYSFRKIVDEGLLFRRDTVFTISKNEEGSFEDTKIEDSEMKLDEEKSKIEREEAEEGDKISHQEVFQNMKQESYIVPANKEDYPRRDSTSNEYEVSLQYLQIKNEKDDLLTGVQGKFKNKDVELILNHIDEPTKSDIVISTSSEGSPTKDDSNIESTKAKESADNETKEDELKDEITVFSEEKRGIETSKELHSDLWTRRLFYTWKLKVYVKKYKKRVFRLCYWPLHVWRREVFRGVLARKKAKFLRNVYQTLTTLQHYRAWQRYLNRRKRSVEICNSYLRKKNNERKQIYLQKWKVWKNEQLRIQTLWDKKGQELRMRSYARSVRELFLLWRYYAQIHNSLRHRARQHYRTLAFQYTDGRYELKRSAVVHDTIPFLFEMSWFDKKSLAKKLFEVSDANGFFDRIGVRGRSLRSFLRQEEIALRMRMRSKFRRIIPRVFEAWKKLARRTRIADESWSMCFYHIRKRYFLRWCDAVCAEDDNEDAESSTYDECDVLNQEPDTKLVNNLLHKKNPFDVHISREDREKMMVEWKESEKWRLKGITLAREDIIASDVKIKEISLARHERKKKHIQLDKINEVRGKDVGIFLKDLHNETLEKKEYLMNHMQTVRDMRGKLMHDVLDKVIDEVYATRFKNYVIKVLRSWRVYVLQRQSMSMFRKNRMKNWCRIAARYRYLNRGMPIYRKFRLLKGCFHKWMILTNESFEYTDPTLMKRIRRRKVLVRRYSEYLEDLSSPGHVANHEQLDVNAKVPVDTKTCLLRWMEYVQKEAVRKRVVSSFNKLTELKRKRTVFTTLLTKQKTKYTFEERHVNKCYNQKRLEKELHRWLQHFVRWERSLHSDWLRRKFHYVQRKTRANALNLPTLKSIDTEMEDNIKKRVSLEKRLLFRAFDLRGISIEEDYKVEAKPKRFFENGGTQPFSVQPVPQGLRVEQILMWIKDKAIVGMQFKYRKMRGFQKNNTDTSLYSERDKSGTTVNGPICGVANGKLHFFNIDESEKLIAIEGRLNVGLSLHSVRFLLTKDRISPWFGNSGALKGSSKPFTIKQSQSMRMDYIIGLYGHVRADSGALVNLGAFYRKVVKHRVFSNCWVNPPFLSMEDKQSGKTLNDVIAVEDKHLSTILRMRESDIQRAFDRARNVMRSIRSGRHRVRGLPSTVFTAAAIGRWTFEALCKRLIRLPRQEADGNMLIARGEEFIQKGSEMIQRGENVLQQIDGYSFDGKHTFDHLSESRKQFILQKVAQNENLMKFGRRIMGKGKTLKDHGTMLLPHLPTASEYRLYIENLYQLTTLQHSMGSSFQLLAVPVEEEEEETLEDFTSYLSSPINHQHVLDDIAEERTKERYQNLKASTGQHLALQECSDTTVQILFIRNRNLTSRKGKERLVPTIYKILSATVINPGKVCTGLFALARRGIPNLDGLVQTTRRQALPIGTPGDGKYTTRMPFQRLLALPRRGIPNLDGLVITTRRKALPIGTPGDG
eukprot:g1457.t1